MYLRDLWGLYRHVWSPNPHKAALTACISQSIFCLVSELKKKIYTGYIWVWLFIDAKINDIVHPSTIRNNKFGSYEK